MTVRNPPPLPNHILQEQNIVIPTAAGELKDSYLTTYNLSSKCDQGGY